MIGVRLSSNELAKLDAWIDSQPSRMTRPAAIRQLLQDTIK